MPRRRLRLALLPVAVLTGIGGACGRGDDPIPGRADATGRFGAVHTEVCRAASLAGAGSVAAARAAFDDVHVGLHDLAAAAGEADRAVAARLLEAKQRVEADLDADSLTALTPPVAAAVEATGGTAPAACP
ncbi:MAG TPA: hypothetical protein VM933_09600 [Acidimicrobiales bacterium]|nr:hypothetical protein [Acidimicrobiales bacterium]